MPFSLCSSYVPLTIRRLIGVLTLSCLLLSRAESAPTPAKAYIIHFEDDIDEALVRRMALVTRPVVLNTSAVKVYITVSERADLLRAHAGRAHTFHPVPPHSKYDVTTLPTVRERAQEVGRVSLLVTLMHVEGVEEEFTTALTAFCPACIVTTERDGHDNDDSTTMIEIIAQNSTDTERLLVDISAQEAVVWVEERPRYAAFNLFAKDVLCGENRASAGGLCYSASHSGEGEVVGVADTGIDMDSCFFQDETTPVAYNSVNSAHRKVVYYATSYGDATEGSSGHGTHVSASIAGASLYDGGGAYNGVAAAAKIAFYDIQSSSGGYLSVPYDLRTLFRPLYAAGARVLSNSWGNPAIGGSSNSYNAASRTVDLFMQQYPDTLVIFAAGNNGFYGTHTVSSPSTNKNGLCVGASMNARESFGDVTPDSYGADSIAYFSSRGPTADNRLKPDVLAPGWFVDSAQSGETCSVSSMAGTSMATPLVAGAAAVAREYFVKGYYPSGSMVTGDAFIPSGALLKAILIHSGRPMARRIYADGSTVTEDSYPSLSQGYGRVTLNRVLKIDNSEDNVDLFVRGGARSSDLHYVSLKTTRDRHTYSLATPASASANSVRITMVYTDIASSSSQSTLLVNRVRMVVTNNDTTEVLQRVNGEWAEDNVIVIDIASPLPNTTYIVLVEALSLISEQSYAIVITGVSSKGLVDHSAGFLQRSLIPRIYRELALAFLLLIIMVTSIVIEVEKWIVKRYANRESERCPLQESPDEEVASFGVTATAATEEAQC